MPDAYYTGKAGLPARHVWLFVSDFNNWAPLVPGYINHEMLNDRQMIWEFTGELGLMKKDIKMHAEIKEWKTEERISFSMQGINEKFTGNGFFHIEREGRNQSAVNGHLNITSKGLAAPVTNAMLKTAVPEILDELAAKMMEKMRALE